MNSPLPDVIDRIKSFSGIQHKRDIQHVAEALRQAWPNPCANGDDCALIPDGYGFKLLAMEGFINSFVEADPWFAGWCGVMVNLSDIAAMGGRPIAVVNALWDAKKPHAELILQGMAAASRAWQVPIVGGHTNLRSDQAQLAVAVLGETYHPLSCFSLRPGLKVMVAINLSGRWHPPGLNWDAATDADPEDLRQAWSLLPHMAEAKLIQAAKDISQAGLTGTLVMMLESAGIGADIDLEAIPCPAGVALEQWLCAFPSFGFLLAVEEDHISCVQQQFFRRGITAAVIGDFVSSPQLHLQYQAQRACYWDLEKQALTGMVMA